MLVDETLWGTGNTYNFVCTAIIECLQYVGISNIRYYSRKTIKFLKCVWDPQCFQLQALVNVFQVKAGFPKWTAKLSATVWSLILHYVRYSVELSKLNSLAIFTVSFELRHMYIPPCLSSHSASPGRYNEYQRAVFILFISKPSSLSCIQSPRSCSTDTLKKMCFTCPKTNRCGFLLVATENIDRD